MNNVSDVKNAIQHNFPQFTITDVVLLGEGMDSRAFLVNGEYVFRFPKYTEIGQKLQIEIVLLPQLRPYVDLTIPDFEFVGKQQDGLPFVGYKKIGDETLTSELLLGVDKNKRNNLITKIGKFLQQIHSFPIDEAQKCGVAVADFKKNYAKDLEETRDKIYHLLDKEMIKYTEKLYGEYLSDKQNFDYSPVLLHADVSPEHIIYDSHTQEIVGIIDFGDVEIGDPDYDLMYLYKDYGPWFIDLYLKIFPCKDPDRLLKKVIFFRRRNTVQDVLTGVYCKDDHLLQWALDNLRREVKHF